jgi:hypothetical protein
LDFESFEKKIVLIFETISLDSHRLPGSSEVPIQFISFSGHWEKFINARYDAQAEIAGSLWTPSIFKIVPLVGKTWSIAECGALCEEDSVPDCDLFVVMYEEDCYLGNSNFDNVIIAGAENILTKQPLYLKGIIIVCNTRALAA